VEPVGQVERQLARHLAARAALIAPVVVLVAFLVRGGDGALGAGIGVAVVALNFLAAAALASYAAPLGPGAIAGAALGGYALRLGIVFGVLFALRDVDAVDMASLVLTIAGAHLALLANEIRSVRLSLAEPGLRETKPLPVPTSATSELASKET
jgi:ATP synthase protein I